MKKVFCDICDEKIAEENPHGVQITADFIIKYDTEHLPFPYHLCNSCSKKVATALESVGLKVPYWSKITHSHLRDITREVYGKAML